MITSLSREKGRRKQSKRCLGKTHTVVHTVPPSPSTKSLTTVYYSKAGHHFSPIDILSPQDLTDAKAYFVREMYTYIHCTVICITRYNLIDGKSLLAEIADADADLKLGSKTCIYLILNNTSRKANQLPQNSLPQGSSAFLPLSLSLSLSTGCGSVSELEFGPIVSRRYIDSQLYTRYFT